MLRVTMCSLPHTACRVLADDATTEQWQALNLILRWHYLLEVQLRDTQLASGKLHGRSGLWLVRRVQGARLVAWDERFDYALLILEEDPVATARPQPWSSTLTVSAGRAICN